MLAYHNDPTLKAAVLAQLRAHIEADQLVQGYGYWKRGKGCAVGCLTHQADGGHDEYETLWGIPRGLAHLEDQIFEGLPPKDARAWPTRFMGAIPVGADLSLVLPRWFHWLLMDADHGMIRYAEDRPGCRAAIRAVGALYARQIAGEPVAPDEWLRARDAASYAADAAYGAYGAYYAAYAAAYAAADAAPYAAADAGDAAARAANAAAYAYAAAAAASYVRQAEKLIKLLAAAPVTEG